MKKEIKEKKANAVQIAITPEIRALFDSYHKETEKEVTRYIGAITEEFQGRVSAIAEQISGMNEKFDTEIKEIKSKLDMHTEMIGQIAVDVEMTKEGVAEIKDELKTKADKTEVIHLNSRVSVLERSL